ncbi:MAG: hypothetical protein ACYDBB_22940 [Armatimonadota bacterium]
MHPSPTLDLIAPVKRLTPAGGHYFYGYYDNPAWDGSDRFHLCAHVPFWDRLQTGEDVAELGMVRLADGAYLPIAETNAWNFQQGAMLQWHPAAPEEEVIFNRFQDGRYVGVIRNIHSGAERLLSRPVANVSPDGRYALGINFSRLFDFRPGYGYANLPDPYAGVAQPEEDGIFLVDLAGGESRLVLSYPEIARLSPAYAQGRKLLVNHITFNTDGTRFVFLVRDFPTDGIQWRTAIFTANADGSHPSCLQDYGYASHYCWRDAEHVLFHCEAGGAWALYLLTDQSAERQLIDPSFFTADGHCFYSPDRRWLLYDSYPVDDYRQLYLYDCAAGRGITLGRFYADPAIAGDIRCDLHPRWNRAGTAISFDSIHEGFRGVYRMDIPGV